MSKSILEMLSNRWDGGLSAACLIGLVLAASQGQGCFNQKSGPTNDVIEESTALPDYLSSIGPNVVIPGLNNFADSVAALSAALDDLSGEVTASDFEVAQDAWRDINFSWQQLEVLQIGPMGSSLSVVDGRDLRDEVYSWPLVNYCRLDQETLEEDWGTEKFFEQNIINVYGIDALEYLLFGGLDGACPSQVPPMADGAWAAKTEVELLDLRLAYAKSLTTQLSVNADEMLDVWSDSGENYSATLAVADGSGVYEDQHDALNAIYRSMFYIETMTKDTKLAHPMGLVDCSTETCVDNLEGLLSDESLESIHANMIGMRSLFLGGADSSAAGMDDLLIDIGHEDLAAQLVTALDAGVAALEQEEQPLSQLIEDGSANLDDVYAAVKGVTDLLKLDLSVVLNVEVPSEAAGDND